MCGIAGIIGLASGHRNLISNSITRMTRSLEHRGPDHWDVWTERNIGLGHTRLRVLDLGSRADQPFRLHNPSRSRSATSTLVFNGEIYNHHSLRRELQTHGFNFRTTCDTETLYHALTYWEEDAIPRLQGMFSFAWYNPKQERVLLARDRMGIKPLYFASHPHALLFASEIRALFVPPLLEPSIDPQAVYQIARFNHTLGDRTAFVGVQSLLPGHFANIHAYSGEITHNRYWKMEFTAQRFSSFEERAHELNARFEASVESHLVADVPIATYLSGGIDSTALTHEAQSQLDNELTSYSMTFPGIDFNEERSINRNLRRTNIKNKQFPISNVTFEDYKSYIHHAEMPQLWTTDLALKMLARAVSQSGHRVVLSGEGPDELFAGYSAYRLMRPRKILESPLVSSLLKRLPAGIALPGVLSWVNVDLSMIQFYLERHNLAQNENREQTLGFYPENLPIWDLLTEPEPESESSIFNPDFVTSMADYKTEEFAWFQTQFAPSVQGYSHLQKNLYFELAVRLPNWVLNMADRMSSAHGLELRVPYLDDNFVENALTLPDEDRIRGNTEKRILKTIHTTRVPPSLIRRHKQPLYTPITEWIHTFFDDPQFKQEWSKERFETVGIFDFQRAQSLLGPLRNNSFSHLRDRLTTEWSFLLVLSTHLLDSTVKKHTAELRSNEL